MSTDHSRVRRTWIVVHQISTDRYFPDHAEQREQYERDKDFEVIGEVLPTRAEALTKIKDIKDNRDEGAE